LACAVSAVDIFFEEGFETEEWEKRWVQSDWKGKNGPAGRFEWSAGEWFVDEAKQKGLRTPKNMRYHSASAKLDKPFSNKGKDLVVQYSVKHEKQEFSFCGGGYIKLLGGDFNQTTFGGNTPYHIMFGPDICGSDIARIHTIFTFDDKNLLRKDDIPLDYDEKNEHSHIYSLHVRPDNTYTVYLDMKEKASGSLHEHWDFPKKSRDDPDDKRPAGWVMDAKIDDPSKQRPDDWVTEARIRDPEALRPSEWDDEEDGEYEAPMIDNPNYKGMWVAEKIDNPDYKGDWVPKQLQNPDYVEDVHAFAEITGVGFELWTVNLGSVFDNILICDSWEHAKKVGDELKAMFDKEKEVKQAWKKANGKEDDADDDFGEGFGDMGMGDMGGAGFGDDDDDDDLVDMDKEEL